MTIYEKLSADFVQARKEKNTFVRDVLMTVKANMDLAIKEKELKGETFEDSDAIKIVNKEIKDTKTALEQSTAREDMVDYLNRKIDLFNTYVPSKMTEEEIFNVLLENGFTHQNKMGEFMKFLNANYKDSLDGKVANKVIREKFLNA